MSTTTIRMPEDLRQRINRVAKRIGTTPHALILNAVAEKAEQEERRAAFEQLADERYAEIIASGETIPWAAMKSCLEARLSGAIVPMPAPQKSGD